MEETMAPVASKPESVGRRRLLQWLAGGALSIAAVAMARVGVRFMTPPITTPRPAPVTVPAAEAPVKNTGRYIAPARAYLMQDAGGYYALSATCTHLGCLLEQGEGGLQCPCHGSRFDQSGAVIAGPAQKPLAHLAVARNDQGDFVIDSSQTVNVAMRLSMP
jgi:cytochrome b6-f complex iron-sulfur subunit